MYVSLQNELTRTAGTIEAWDYILKKIDHSQKRLQPDVFIKERYPLIIGRQRQFFDDMIQPLKKRVKVPEFFCKQSNTRYTYNLN